MSDLISADEAVRRLKDCLQSLEQKKTFTVKEEDTTKKPLGISREKIEKIEDLIQALDFLPAEDIKPGATASPPPAKSEEKPNTTGAEGQRKPPKSGDLYHFGRHGKCISLSDDGLTAERTGSPEEAGQSDDGLTAERTESPKEAGDGIVLSREKMEPGFIYEVELDKAESNFKLAFGITPHNDPASLPQRSTNLKVSFKRDLHSGKKGKPNPKTGKIGEGCRVGLMLDDKERVHVFIDGEDDSEPLDKRYVFFDLIDKLTKVTALPLRRPSERTAANQQHDNPPADEQHDNPPADEQHDNPPADEQHDNPPADEQHDE